MDKRIFNIMSAFMAISPAFAMYLFLPGAELAKFIALLFSIIIVFIFGTSWRSKDTSNFFTWVVVITIVSTIYHSMTLASWFSTTHVINNLLSSAFTFIPIIFLSGYINPKVFIKVGVYFGIVVSLVVIWQRVLGVLTGSFPTDFFLPGFEINRDIDTFSVDRPSAFFTEPAHLCIFMLPFMFTTLLYRKYLLSAFYTFAILCSGSTTGFIMVVVLLAVHMLETNSSHKIRNIIALILGATILYYLILAFFPQIIVENFDKLGGVQEGKSDIRLLGPLEYFKSFDGFEKFFGITLNLLENYLVARLSLYDMKNFSNGALFMLLSYGYIGFICLIVFVIRLWKKCPSTKGYIVIFIGIICSDQILFNPHFMYLVLFVLSTERLHEYIANRGYTKLLEF